MAEENNTGYIDFIKGWWRSLLEWVKPNPADGLFLKIVKMIFKSIILLILVALSPVILVVLLFVFFAAV